MSFRFGELRDSRSSSLKDNTEERRYFATGSSDRLFIEAYALSTTPSVLVTSEATLYRQDVKIDWRSGNYAVVTIPFAKDEKQAGSFTWNFDTTGGTVNIKASLSTVASYPPGAAQHGGAINVNGDNVEGCDIVIPALKINAEFRHPKGVNTIARAKQLARNTGKVNSGEMLTFAEGEVLFLGATGSDGSDAEATVSYQLACSENLQDQIIAGINVAAKQGWDIAWIEFKPDVAAGEPIRPAKAIHVERVYRRTDLAALLGFG